MTLGLEFRAASLFTSTLLPAPRFLLGKCSAHGVSPSGPLNLGFCRRHSVTGSHPWPGLRCLPATLPSGRT